MGKVGWGRGMAEQNKGGQISLGKGGLSGIGCNRIKTPFLDLIPQHGPTWTCASHFAGAGLNRPVCTFGGIPLG